MKSVKYRAILSAYQILIPSAENGWACSRFSGTSVEIDAPLGDIVGACAKAVLKANTENPGYTFYVTAIKQA